MIGGRGPKEVQGSAAAGEGRGVEEALALGCTTGGGGLGGGSCGGEFSHHHLRRYKKACLLKLGK